MKDKTEYEIPPRRVKAEEEANKGARSALVARYGEEALKEVENP